MRIKCTKTLIYKPEKNILNSDMRDYLSIGELFWVYGIRFSTDITYVYIFDNNHLFEVSLELFEIVENRMPNRLRIKLWTNGDLTLWPDLFYENGFLENFSEREEKEREAFSNLLFETEN